jgi:hypothetical protein
MKKLLSWTLLAILPSLLAGCLTDHFTPQPAGNTVVVITVVITTTPQATVTPGESAGPIAIATALRTPATPTQTPSATPSPEPSPTPTATATPPPSRSGRNPTPVPDYAPGKGLAVLMGESPYALTILPGGWQAYQIGPSANPWGYLVDVNPHGPAPEGTYIDSKILPEYFAGQWVDVLWLRAPGLHIALPVTVDLISTQGWDVTYENHPKLTPGEWTGWAMFDSAEGCGGLLDISPDAIDPSGRAAFIENTRVQPEFPGSWIQVARVQLSNLAVSQNAWLRYYAPGLLGVEELRKNATLSPGRWNEFLVANSYVRQGYVFEVIPQKDSDNEVAFAVVRPESNGEWWEDVLRVYVPEGRPPLEALLRVVAVRVAGQ